MIEDAPSRDTGLLRRLAAHLERPITRLTARTAGRAVAAGLTALFLIAGGLSLEIAALGLAAAVGWAAFWPLEAPSAEAGATITRKNEREAKLWRMAVDAVPEPIVVLDRNGLVAHINGAAKAQFGPRRRGGHFAAVSRDPAFLDAVERALAAGEDSAVELHEHVPIERRRVASVVALKPRRMTAAAPAVLISFRDMTGQDRLARMRADFVANASHELRTPLASLKGFVETLQGAAKDDPAARERFLGVMSDQADRMARLIDDLLSLSNVEMREHVPLSGRVDLNEAASHAVQSLKPLADKSGATVTLQELAEPALIQGDRDEMVQLLQNLIQNAIKYGKPDGRVAIAVAREPAGSAGPQRFIVSVTDDGPGIASQHLPRLTERFYRVSATASRATGGTGLGLAIAKHILNRHRGELTITSTLGQGSTFAVALPAAPDDAPAA
jgi:two-component system phosphate regulon sensor histidine kinase PhoR